MQPKGHVSSFAAASKPSKIALEALQISAEQPSTMPRPRSKEWDFVVVTKEVEQGKGGDPEVECIFCDREPFRAGAIRIRAHILGDQPGLGVAACKPTEYQAEAHAAAVEALLAIQKSIAEVRNRKRKADKLESHQASAAAASSSGRQSTIAEGFQKMDKAGTDRAVASMWFANGLSFNVARNAYTRAAFKAVSEAGPGYTLPGSEALRTSLLDSMYSHVETQLQPARDSRVSLGCTVTGDGWTNVQNRSLFNFIVVTPEGPVFEAVVDTSGHEKNARYIADQFIKVIDSIGPENVIQVVTDSAAACKLAGSLITEQYPHITWTACGSHVLDLLLEDVGKLTWAAGPIRKARKLVKFITNHHMAQALYRKHSALQLLKPGRTQAQPQITCKLVS